MGASPDGDRAVVNGAASVSALRASVPSAYETLDQFAERTGVPRDEESGGAVDWVVGRLSNKQCSALLALAARPDRDWAYASEVGAGSTLNSLWDFKRGERDCLAPLALCHPDWAPRERCCLWQITRFGRLVAQAIEAGTAETGTGSVHESVVSAADAPGTLPQRGDTPA